MRGVTSCDDSALRSSICADSTRLNDTSLTYFEFSRGSGSFALLEDCRLLAPERHFLCTIALEMSMGSFNRLSSMGHTSPA
jgi:hypothetical protein